MASDRQRLWGAAAGAIATVAGAARTGDIVVENLTGGRKLTMKWSSCRGRYGGSGPCLEGPLLDVIAGTFVTLLLLLTTFFFLHTIRKIRWQRHLRAHGTRVAGVVVASTRLSPPTRRGPLRVRIRAEAPAIPGLVAGIETNEALPEGTPVTVAYDPGKLRRGGVILDDGSHRSDGRRELWSPTCAA